MKKLLKDKKKLVLISLVAVLVIAAVIAGVVALNRKPMEEAPPDTTASNTTGDITVSVPEIPDDSNSDTEGSHIPNEIEDDGSALKPDESVLPAESKTPGSKADTNDTPASEKEPPKAAEPENTGGGIQIGGNPPVEETYKCGSVNHHCQDADTHAYILNLELEGCSMCGSHSCPSFYATDKWGGATIDYTKCPQYSIKSDPTKYCQECGREKWSVDNPTGCFRYLQDTQCECGELVKGNTCHHH